MDENTRNQVADSLSSLADQSEWNVKVWERCYQLVEGNSGDELLSYVIDDLIHYSGVFHNLFGRRVEPNKVVLEGYRQEFRDVATALRSGLSLSEAKRKFDL